MTEPQPAAGSTTVGQSAGQMDLLSYLIAFLSTPSPHVLLITGSLGIGKTSLLTALRRGLNGSWIMVAYRRNPPVAAGPALTEGSSPPVSLLLPRSGRTHSIGHIFGRRGTAVFASLLPHRKSSVRRQCTPSGPRRLRAFGGTKASVPLRGRLGPAHRGGVRPGGPARGGRRVRRDLPCASQSTRQSAHTRDLLRTGPSRSRTPIARRRRG